jgi:PPK2 family polyphosphate:nucleotide phosphotransferase
MTPDEIVERCRVPPGKCFRMEDHDPGWAPTAEWKQLGKDEAKERAKVLLEMNLASLTEAQHLLFADGRYAVLVILQGMDASGKDGTIKHVMSGVNPQGCQVFSFKKPSAEELAHDFLWRCAVRLPERGKIGMFNRSYYEDVLVVRVHPELLEGHHLPPGKRGKSFWEARYEAINAFERHLVRDGTIVVKFFLNVSEKEQKRRFLERLERPEKHWKFSPADIAERAHWDEYVVAYEDTLSATSTDWAPWYVVPGDHKWASRAIVADILTSIMRSLDLRFPKVTEDQRKALQEAKEQLEKE